MKTRALLCVLAAAALALVGCKTPIQDITPDKLEANPSGIYTFRMELNLPSGKVIDGTLRTQIVINGETHEMKPSDMLGDDVHEFEYRVPGNVANVKYYYVVSYDYIQDGRKLHAERYAPADYGSGQLTYSARITNRYVVMLSAGRSPVGVPVSVMGAGFSNLDKVEVNGVEAETQYVSPTTLIFTVPPLDAGQRYPVTVVTGEGRIEAGLLRIDSSTLTVQPARISLSVGERDQLTFYIEGPAPAGGLYLDVQTDVPQSVIMPEVTIPAGSRSVSVPVEAGSAGQGTLWITALGYDEVAIPVVVE